MSTRRRRCLRFSLGTFLVLLTIGCVAFGVATSKARRQRQIVQWVLGHGGTVNYDYQLVYTRADKSRWETHPNAKPPAPDWACNIFGIDCFADVNHVRFAEINSEQEIDVTPLAQLSHLTWIELYKTNVTNATALAGLKHLKWLTMMGSNVSDEECLVLQEALPDCTVITWSFNFTQ